MFWFSFCIQNEMMENIRHNSVCWINNTPLSQNIYI
jgi:hypothetical protein